jgi:hypothetical protein
VLWPSLTIWKHRTIAPSWFWRGFARAIAGQLNARSMGNLPALGCRHVWRGREMKVAQGTSLKNHPERVQD